MGERSDTSKSGKDAFDVCPRTTCHKSLVRVLSGSPGSVRAWDQFGKARCCYTE